MNPEVSLAGRYAEATKKLIEYFKNRSSVETLFFFTLGTVYRTALGNPNEQKRDKTNASSSYLDNLLQEVADAYSPLEQESHWKNSPALVGMLSAIEQATASGDLFAAYSGLLAIKIIIDGQGFKQRDEERKASRPKP